MSFRDKYRLKGKSKDSYLELVLDFPAGVDQERGAFV